MTETSPVEFTPTEYATIGRRIGAYFVDGLFGAAVALGTLLTGVVATILVPPVGRFILLLGYPLAMLVFGIYVWNSIATRAHSPGMKALGLRVVDVQSGKPIGRGRALVRQLVLGVLVGLSFGVLAIVIAVLASSHPRRQGWHDLVARSVVVPESALVSLRPPRPEPLEGILPVRIPTPGGAAQAGPPPAPVAIPSPLVVPVNPEPPVTVAPVPSGPASPAPAVSEASEAPIVKVVTPPGLVPDPPGLAAQPPKHSVPAAVDEETRLASRRSSPSWSLVPRLGRAQQISGIVVVGRDPNPALAEGATAWSVDDPERTVSKTHAVVRVDGDLLTIEDWDSSNGVVVVRGGDEIVLQPRVAQSLNEGDELLLGDFAVDVRRGV